jgi:arylsulfatase
LPLKGSEKLCIVCFSFDHPTEVKVVSRTTVSKILPGLAASFFAATVACVPAVAQQQKPNIIMIMGDDIGMWNIGAYHRGLMAGRTPNLDQLAAEGMMFTDYYAEASCTAGRANFVTGELPIRTGLTTVGQAGSSIGMPAEAPTIATVLKSQGCPSSDFLRQGAVAN